LRLQHGSGTLGRDPGFRALAAALGTVEGAFLAPRGAPAAFPVPRGGHRGPHLHPFTLYALAYQEPQPGRRFVEIALEYARRADARAAAATLRRRLRGESLPVYGDSWAHLTSLAGISVHGSVLVARLRLRPTTPPILWLDAITEGDLSILSS
jgi:hypothetical protein